MTKTQKNKVNLNKKWEKKMKKLVLCGLFFTTLCLYGCGTVGGAISGLGADLDMVGGAIAGY